MYQNALDETGTVSTEGLSEARSFDSTIATEFTERLEIEGVTEEILSVHGMAPRKKPEGVTRLYTKILMVLTLL